MMQPELLPAMSSGREEYAERVATVIAAAFAQDTLNRAVLLTRHSLPNNTQLSNKLRFEHFLPSIRDKAEAGGILLEAGDWAAVAVWVPPGVASPPMNRSVMSSLSLEYHDKWSKAKKKHLGERKYWYLNYLGRDPDRNERGVIRALLDPYLRQAQEAGLPAWLEATSEHARDVYSHLGFEVVEEIIIGAGVADARGNLVSNGEGIKIYGMIAEPRI